MVKEEEKTLKFWEDNDIFEKSLAATKEGHAFVFYEGPPTANGRPGIHHILARAFKDIICRYQTMRGRYVARRAGWDTHGLPVEIEVEKKLGLKNKREVEKYGIAKFNEECRKSVWQYKDEWEKLTRRMGFWLDLKKPYITYEPRYIENVWGIVKKIWDSKLLVKDYKIVPFCVRCGTPISSHEVAQGYEIVTDKSVIVKFKVKGLADTYLLAWTTTPWTLPGNVALAVGPKIVYAEAESDGEKYILAKDLAERVFGNRDYKIIRELKSSEVAKMSYEPLFKVKELASPQSYKVYPADFVSTSEGTGIVHTAVMYGADDFELGAREGLPKFHTVDREGAFVKSVSVVAGLAIVSGGRKDAVTEKAILFYLKKQGLLFGETDYSHEYPFCWRCKSPLLYYAQESWFIKMSALRRELIKNNQKINWVPEHLKEGRFGEWLREVKDWAISRERYWGTPLPVWECKKCPHRLVVGSLAELNHFRADKPAVLILMRHGEAESNVGGFCSSYPEQKLNPLTERGRKQVEAAAKKIKSGLGKEKSTVVYSSDLLRARETAQIVADELKTKNIIFDPRLREIDTGQFSGQAVEKYRNYFDSFKDRFVHSPPQGESWLDVAKRVRDFTADVSHKHPGKKIIVVSHMDPLFLIQTSQGVYGDDEIELAYQTAVKSSKIALGLAEFAEFSINNWPYDEAGNLDLHRPYVDNVILKCSKCSGKMERVKDLMDVWFDSGAMPWASRNLFPADYICEAIDQTRGWFYTLLAVSTALGSGAPYKNVISLNHVLDDKGEKMSKSRGNIVDPWMVGEKVGFDAMRWYFYSVNAPGDNKLFNLRDLESKKRRFADTLVNSCLFLETYHDNAPASLAPRPDILDSWILERLVNLELAVAKNLDVYDVTSAARDIEEFVDELSNWYIRRSRRKFQKQKMDAEKLAAQNTLEQVLRRVSVLLAPFTPFLAEWLYQELRGLTPANTRINADNQRKSTFDPRASVLSVHLEKWPVAKKTPKKSDVMKIMDKAREIVALGLAERARVGIRVRQPLAALYLSPADYNIIGDVLYLVDEELNVKKVLSDRKIAKDTVVLDTELTAELKEEGLVRELTRNINDMRKEAGLTPEDKIILYYDVRPGQNFQEFFSRWEEIIKAETRSSQIHFGMAPGDNFLVHKTWNHSGYEIGVGIKKVS